MAKHVARKRFGQNFLADTMVLESIMHHANINASEHVIEIGPGLGALTALLLKACGRLDVIEIDNDLIPHLESHFSHHKHFFIHHKDVLKISFTELSKDEKPLRIIGNLPYNIATEIIFNIIKCNVLFKDCIFMLQKEVANRLAAKSGTKAYGRLSVMVQRLCKVRPIIHVPPAAFDPPPKVDSTVIQLIPIENPMPVNSSSEFEHVVRTAFNQRRKTITNSLGRLFTADDFTSLNIDPKSRAENLSVSDYVKLSNLKCP